MQYMRSQYKRMVRSRPHANAVSGSKQCYYADSYQIWICLLDITRVFQLRYSVHGFNITENDSLLE